MKYILFCRKEQIMEDNIEKERILQVTADGSHTLYLPDMNEHYHSVNGAVQESEHIFINAGLKQIEKEEIHLLEIGFGTGLNALLTLKEVMEGAVKRNVIYHSVELYPLDLSVVEQLNYGERVWKEHEDFFLKLHQAPWDTYEKITPQFTLYKIKGDSNHCELPQHIDLIYFDAFAPEKQPKMWSQDIFNKLYEHANDNAIIMTYCAKGVVRRSMQAAGFLMERLPGPPGKRHILRGRKQEI